MAFQLYIIVSDNDYPIMSSEFAEVTKKNVVHHVKVSTYYSSSKRMAERAARTFQRRDKRVW